MADGGADEELTPVEWVDLGETSRAAATESLEGGSREPWRPRPWHVVIGVVVAALVGVAAWPRGDGKPPPAAAPTPTSTQTTSTPTDLGPTPTYPEPVVSQVGPKILGVDAGWELFGRGAGVVVRVELATGRVTTTEVPSLLSSGPVGFVVGRDRALVRPLDDVPGYVVRDGSAAAPLRGSLQAANIVLPGPDPSHIWRQVGGNDPPDLALADLDGTVVGPRISPPFGVSSPLVPDGSGYLAIIGVSGVYDARPGSTQRLTTGSLLAVGPNRWVSVECDDSYRCSTVVIDVKTGARRVIGAPLSPNVPVGAVAPGGSVAVIYHQSPSGTASLQLVDLRTGQLTAVRSPIDQAFQDNNLAWSPDGRMLFVIDPRGRVQVINLATGAARPLGVKLPPLIQLAVRPSA